MPPGRLRLEPPTWRDAPLDEARRVVAEHTCEPLPDDVLAELRRIVQRADAAVS